VMTRSALKGLWVGGGGVLATWIAVSPNSGVPVNSPATVVPRPAAASQPEELNAQAMRLRDRSRAATLGPSTRNPFRFSSPKRDPQPTRESVVETATAPVVPAGPPPPLLTLAGVAQKAGIRTGIITGAGQIYLVGEGDSVAGLYTVVKVDPEAVVLRDTSGAEQRLVLPQ
jgi:hypothetical protein